MPTSTSPATSSFLDMTAAIVIDTILGALVVGITTLIARLIWNWANK